MTAATVARYAALGVAALYSFALHLGAGVASKFIAYLPTMAVLLTIVFEKWAWKLSWVAMVVGRPRLEGVWAVTLQPDQQSHIPAGGNRGPIAAYLVVEQSLFVMHVAQYTAESTSNSTACSFSRNGDSKDRQTLSFTYRNEPRQQHQHRSQPHAGACEVYVSGLEPVEMEGRYWTTRFTAGDMKLAFLDRKTSHASFSALQQEYGGS